jgi:hypothetical protein
MAKEDFDGNRACCGDESGRRQSIECGVRLDRLGGDNTVQEAYRLPVASHLSRLYIWWNSQECLESCAILEALIVATTALVA